MTKVLKGAALGLLAALSLGQTAEAAYPDRPVTIIVPWAAGGGTDATGRILAKMLQDELKQPFNVVNRTGGGGVVGHAAISQAPADGYTIGVVTIEVGTFRWLGQSEIKSTDYTPIALYNFDPGALFVSSASPIQNGKAAFDQLKGDPKKFKVASGSSVGGAWHMALGSAMLKVGLKPDAYTWIPSQGAAPALQELFAGGTDFTPASLPEAKSLMDAGKVKPLMVFDTQRQKAYPDVPTSKEAVGAEVKAGAWRGIAGPKGMPKEASDTIAKALKKIHDSKEFRDFMDSRGFGLEWASGDDFAKFMAQSEADCGTVLKAIGLAK